MNVGKQKCEILKCIRKQIAERYHLVYTPFECKHEGDCAGTCSTCDAELLDLQLQLTEMGKNEIDLYDDIIGLLEEMELAEEEDWEEGIILQGAYSGDTRSPIPVISVHSVGNFQYRFQN